MVDVFLGKLIVSFFDKDNLLELLAKCLAFVKHIEHELGGENILECNFSDEQFGSPTPHIR